MRDGAKARLVMNILSLSISAREKCLDFSQYILPMKFLERLLVKVKGWPEYPCLLNHNTVSEKNKS